MSTQYTIPITLGLIFGAIKVYPILKGWYLYIHERFAKFILRRIWLYSFKKTFNKHDKNFICNKNLQYLPIKYDRLDYINAELPSFERFDKIHPEILLGKWWHHKCSVFEGSNSNPQWFRKHIEKYMKNKLNQCQCAHNIEK